MRSSQPCKSSQEDKRALALGCVEVLGRLASLFEERRRQLAEGAGMTVGQWQVLEEIQTEHFMPSLFAQRRASSAAAVSKVLRQLTDKGLIVAQLSQEDARKRDYSVTQEGKRLLGRVREQRKHAIEEVWLKLSRDELIGFDSIGTQLAERLEDFAASSCSK
jgi:DNA-binding MarR family transcriptional regulator